MNNLLNEVAHILRQFYGLPWSGLAQLHQLLGIKSLGYFDAFLIMSMGFVLFTAAFNVGGRFFRSVKFPKIWFFVGNLCFSQIEFLLASQASIRKLSHCQLILMSAAGFLTLDLPLTVAYSEKLGISALVLLLWKLLSLAVLVGIFWKLKIELPRLESNKTWTHSLKSALRVAAYSGGSCALLSVGIYLLTGSTDGLPIPADGPRQGLPFANPLLNILCNTLIFHEGVGFDALQAWSAHFSPAKLILIGLGIANFTNLTSVSLQLGAYWALTDENFFTLTRIIFLGFLSALGVNLLMITPAIFVFFI